MHSQRIKHVLKSLHEGGKPLEQWLQGFKRYHIPAYRRGPWPELATPLSPEEAASEVAEEKAGKKSRNPTLSSSMFSSAVSNCTLQRQWGDVVQAWVSLPTFTGGKNLFFSVALWQQLGKRGHLSYGCQEMEGVMLLGPSWHCREQNVASIRIIVFPGKKITMFFTVGLSLQAGGQDEK